MGQLFSGPYHRAELQMRRSNQILDYQPQPPEEIMQLDTEVDQRGNTTVNYVFKTTRDVYGQKAHDLKLRTVEWRDYGIDLKNRPSPFEFPAFEHEERINEARNNTITQEVAPSEKAVVKAKPSADVVKATAPTSKDATGSKEPTNKATTSAPEKRKRFSHNQEMDNCSLEDEG